MRSCAGKRPLTRGNLRIHRKWDCRGKANIRDHRVERRRLSRDTCTSPISTAHLTGTANRRRDEVLSWRLSPCKLSTLTPLEPKRVQNIDKVIGHRSDQQRGHTSIETTSTWHNCNCSRNRRAQLREDCKCMKNMETVEVYWLHHTLNEAKNIHGTGKCYWDKRALANENQRMVRLDQATKKRVKILMMSVVQQYHGIHTVNYD